MSQPSPLQPQDLKRSRARSWSSSRSNGCNRPSTGSIATSTFYRSAFDAHWREPGKADQGHALAAGSCLSPRGRTWSAGLSLRHVRRAAARHRAHSLDARDVAGSRRWLPAIRATTCKHWTECMARLAGVGRASPSMTSSRSPLDYNLIGRRLRVSPGRRTDRGVGHPHLHRAWMRGKTGGRSCKRLQDHRPHHHAGAMP